MHTYSPVISFLANKLVYGSFSTSLVGLETVQQSRHRQHHACSGQEMERNASAMHTKKMTVYFLGWQQGHHISGNTPLRWSPQGCPRKRRRRQHMGTAQLKCSSFMHSQIFWSDRAKFFPAVSQQMASINHLPNVPPG